MLCFSSTKLGHHLSTSPQSQSQICRRQGPRPSPAYRPRWAIQLSVSPRKSFLLAAASAGADLVEVELEVEGLECGACSSRVHDAVLKLDNVKKADIRHEDGKAILQVDAPSLFDAWNQLPQILETIDALGFKAHPCLGDKEE